MRIFNSILQDLLQDLPHLRSQMYFKSALTALSHAMEDLILAGSDSPLVIANFQQERFYQQEIRRYQQIAQQTDHVYVLAAPETDSGFAVASGSLETIPLMPNDGLAQEWHLVIIGEQYTACLICREQLKSVSSLDQTRRFEGLWTFDPQVTTQAARLLLGRIANYRPELNPKVEEAWQRYHLTKEVSAQTWISTPQAIDTAIFAQRLVTYLQATQYKLLKAYRVIATQERQERLINIISTAVRSSLNPQEVLTVVVQELGKLFNNCRCLLYRFRPPERQAKIEYESVPPGMLSLKGRIWSLADNPLFLAVQTQDKALAINDVAENPYLYDNATLRSKIERASIKAWLLVPIRYQGSLLGMLELHYGGEEPYEWQKEDIELVQAIATQAGVALTQAQSYTDLATLNRQLETLERTQSNLIAIVGHELRTPLSTIQVCLESLATEPDMATEFRETMLEVALTDSERMRRLIQDFLVFSKLDSRQAYRRSELIQLNEAIDLALSNLKTRWSQKTLPSIKVELSPNLPLLKADGEGLIEVLIKLLDNACKFTESMGEIRIEAGILDAQIDLQADSPMLEIIVADTGRGIEPDLLEVIFDRFYQEEDWLRRTVGGTGLGLAICRQIIQGMGGKIWAASEGKNQGSQFHFTVPIA